jgi:NAD(P)H-quinone oxidoreductase subunit 5
LTRECSHSSINLYEFITNAISSVSLAIFGLLIAYILYGSTYYYYSNFEFNKFHLQGKSKKVLFYEVKNIYNWSYNCGYIDIFYTRVFTLGIRGLTELTEYFDKGNTYGITSGVGLVSFCIGEEIKYVGGGRISSYLFFFMLCILCLFLFSSLT